MSNINNFVRDLNAEQVLGDFLNDFYYPRMNFTGYKRITDQNNQYAGIDVILTQNGKELLIDEKGLMSIPKPISTFALELSYLNGFGERKIGWLFDTHKRSTNYLLCWIKRNDVPVDSVQLSDIHYVTAMFVSRDSLQEYLFNTYQINSESAQTKVNNILTEGVSGRLENLSEESNSRYHFSDYLPEKPINIVMTQKELIQSGAAISYHLVKRSGISDI